MKIYSWFVNDGDVLIADVMHRWQLHANLCCDPDTPKAGHIVEVAYTVGKSNIENSAEIEQHPDYIGADGTDPDAFKAWLIGRGVASGTANDIATSGDIHGAMHAFIAAQS